MNTSNVIPFRASADRTAKEVWIAIFTKALSRVAPNQRGSAGDAMAATLWQTCGHREPATVMQALLMQRYLEAGDDGTRAPG